MSDAATGSSDEAGDTAETSADTAGYLVQRRAKGPPRLKSRDPLTHFRRSKTCAWGKITRLD
ncbi:hypothetical protein [Candidatus Poriferisodalis sp.]|uniref:hypothetical protein n=1 Tax=Candidatus Poriferisodalis sp. TaxID=3101277 RepID=UPI003B023A24